MSICKKCKQRGDVLSCTTSNNKEHHSYNDKPAIEYVNESRRWYKNGKIHRKNNAAIINADGDRTWCFNGLYHRTSGPAIDWSGRKEWYWKGSKCSEEEWKKQGGQPKRKKSTTTSSFEKNNNNLLFALVLIPVIVLGFWLKV